MPEQKDFIAVFKAEAEDHLSNLDKGLVELEKNPDNLELTRELNREAHTLKGSARVFGYHKLQEIAHRIEDIFDEVTQKKLAFSSAIADIIFKGLDIIRAILAKTVKEEKTDIDISNICKELEECLQPQVAQKITGREKVKGSRTRDDGEKDESGIRSGTEDTRISASAEEYIRVPLSRVNKLLNLAGEMVISKMKSSAKIMRMKRLAKLSKEAQKKISDLGERLKEQKYNADAEVKKLLSQCNADMQKLREDSFNLYDNIAAETLRLDPVIDELQAKMKEIRMLPCATIFKGFPRMIRDIASQEKKEVDLVICGEETELDKKVLERIKTPLMHILRNCVDHGIEEPDERVTLGKPRVGTIRLSAYHEADNVVITVEDDGKGIDIEEIKQTALRKHLVSNDELNEMTEKEIQNIILMNGFSTSPIITDVSGRGIGLDIVRRDIGNLKGQLNLDTGVNRGTKFTLVLPLTIAIIRVLLLKTQGLLFALPMDSIAESLRVKKEEVSTIEGKMAIQVRRHTVPVVILSEILGLPKTRMDEDADKNRPKETIPVVIISSLDKRVGFIVDDIISEDNVFIKSIGQHLGKVNNVSGATILGTGEVVVVLDGKDLVINSALSHPAIAVRQPVPKEKRKEKRILVVDDALSTRELEKSILETEGYCVDTAVDGLDALDRVTQAKYEYNLIVTDIQMPRMDGFEFCRALKENDEYKDIPVVIVTAKDKEEDKRVGVEVGAAAYIVKAAFDQTNLLDTIERLIG